ncbi:N-acetylmuramic acid 6-phosphate etherase [Vibrio astriarenae]|uniref:N-acetylmuramic acid 6-phosphate etherase n=1 Tax=Vibrio astriarenae TaxID=1481923 RepID=A0A7Z2T1G8_9VIBR|nr:N-acetylmuramic acid 6-phosphate etherase [Vibrio astriarenae]QIA62547.1 N-acetylmuramic acid 6-phosphate etherase [Vibrio astriarenae]
MSDNQLLNTLSKLVSEGRNPDTMDLDSVSTLELVSKINQQDKLVPLAVEKELPNIAKAVDVISHAFRQGGRLFYCGAGTSGRLGILDASECPPTFGVDESMVVGVIAGGHEAIFRAQEGAEDSPQLGQDDLINHQLTANDVVVGIAASGRTPYVIGALNYANSIGAQTVALSCNPDSAIAHCANIAISPVVGPEALTGSTRMKSGTAQKLVLNMLTTASMVRIGKSYQNLMVDVKATNKKLVARAVRIVMQATECSAEQATQALEQCEYEVKTAILIQLTGLSCQEARRQIQQTSGFLGKAIQQAT